MQVSLSVKCQPSQINRADMCYKERYNLEHYTIYLLILIMNTNASNSYFIINVGNKMT
jgi:predicted transcriptional regulator with HTH domain